MPAFPFERRQNVLCMFFIVNFVLFNVDIVLLNLMLVVILLANLTLCCSFNGYKSTDETGRMPNFSRTTLQSLIAKM